MHLRDLTAVVAWGETSSAKVRAQAEVTGLCMFRALGNKTSAKAALQLPRSQLLARPQPQQQAVCGWRVQPQQLAGSGKPGRLGGRAALCRRCRRYS